MRLRSRPRRRRFFYAEGSSPRVASNFLGQVVVILERLVPRGMVAGHEGAWLPRLPGGPGRRITADQLLEIGKVDELVGLPAQLVSDHRGLRLQRRDDADPAPVLLQGRDEARKSPSPEKSTM